MKKRFKLAFGLSAVALLSLAACSGQVKEDPFLKEIENAPVETDEDILNEINVVGAEDGIYGNIYLPEEVDGAEITWWSSDHDTIYPERYDDIAPGEVYRHADDTSVKLIAKIEKDGQISKYEQEVLVKGLPYSLEDDDYEAYLFAHFCGEADQYGKTIDGQRVTNGEQIFFALADVGEGLHFKDMNGSKGTNYDSLKPVLTSDVGERGVRDPFMLRSPEGDTFYLIATDLSIYTRGGWGMNNGNAATKTGSHSITLWESHDLVNWTKPRLIEVAREDAGMAWAPEMIFCEETGEYMIFFSSTILDDVSKGANANIIWKDCVYYTTTRDFVHFSETKRFIPGTDYQEDVTSRNESERNALNNDQRKVIDGSVMKIGDYYYSACKDGGNNEDGGGIRIMKAESLLPEIDDEGEEYIAWEFVQNLSDVGFKVDASRNEPDGKPSNKCLEGPEWFFYNKADRENEDVPEIGLMADFYANTSVGYIPWCTTDVEDINNENSSWKKLESGSEKGTFSWDAQTKRHGTILRITADEAELLKENFPIAQ